MNHRAAVLGLLVATGIAVRVGAAREEPGGAELDRVVRLWAAATGGLDHIRALRAVRMSGKITLGGEPHAFTVEVARPGRIRTEVTFPQGVWVQVFDGKHGWTVSPLDKSPAPAPMTADQERNAPEQADIEGPLVNSAKKGIRLTLEGKETVDGREAWRIRVTRGDGVVRYLDLDAATSLKVRWEGELGEGNERKMNASLFSDYRKVGGLSFPFRIVSGVLGEEPSQEIVFETIELNPAIPDSAFAAPK